MNLLFVQHISMLACKGSAMYMMMSYEGVSMLLFFSTYHLHPPTLKHTVSINDIAHSPHDSRVISIVQESVL